MKNLKYEITVKQLLLIILFLLPSLSHSQNSVEKGESGDSNAGGQNSPATASYNFSSLAYINYADVITAMPEYKQMQDSLLKSENKFQIELKTLSNEYLRKLSDFLKQQNALSENIKGRRQQELDGLRERIALFQQEAQQEQDTLQQRLLEPVQNKLQKAINDAGTENNFLYIIRSEALVFTLPGEVDATSLIKRKLGIPISTDNSPAPYNPAPANLSSLAYINYTDVITAMPEYKQMQDSLQKSENELQIESTTLSDEYSNKLSDYLNQQNSLSESIKERRQQELDGLHERAVIFQQEAQQKQDTLQQKLLEPVQNKLQKAIYDAGMENSFRYIIRSEALVFTIPSAVDATSLINIKLGIPISTDNSPAPYNPAPANLSSLAYINYIDVITAMPEYKQMQDSLQKSENEFQIELKRITDEYSEKMSDYLKQRNSLNQSIKDRREQELDGLRERAVNFQQEAQQAQDATQQRLSASIQDKLQKAINDAGTENGFFYIVRSEAFVFTLPGAVNATSLIKRKLGI